MAIFSKPPALNHPLRRRHPKPLKTIYEALSEAQAAYAVFIPKPDDFFNLFEIIFLHQERYLSPRNTNTNLREIFEELQDDPNVEIDSKLVDAFLKQFNRVRHEEYSRDPEVMQVSEESLREAGLTIFTPIPSLVSKASKSYTRERQIRLLWLSLDAYTGRKTLEKLVWNHAEAVFLLILQGLHSSYFPRERGDKTLMGIVTKRIMSKVGTSVVDEKGAAVLVKADSGTGSGVADIGAIKAEVLRYAYEDKYGVSGLHFIAFKIECLERHRWKVYKGIDVCDSELDESDDFNEAVRWHRGSGSLNNATQNEYKTVTDDDCTGSRSNSRNAAVSDGMTRKDSENVVVTYMDDTAPFIEIDIRPCLSAFANKQCRLATLYRKMDGSNTKKRDEAVWILRSVLQKCCFESTIRALYDLSGCYRHGIGVTVDVKMGRLLRYCAGGMRRNYDTRELWLSRLVMEIGFRHDFKPECSIASMAVLSRWRPVSTKHTSKYVPREDFSGRRSCEIVVQGGPKVDFNALFAEMMYAKAVKLEKGADLYLDLVRAEKLYEKAIKIGRHVKSMNNLAVLLMRGTIAGKMDEVRAKELYEEAIKETRDVFAMTQLANMLRYGTRKVKADPLRAKELYEELIKEKRDVSAMSQLADMLQYGAKEVKADPLRAKELYEELIKKKRDVFAMSQLAYILQSGAKEVKADPLRAKELYEEVIKKKCDFFVVTRLTNMLLYGAKEVRDPLRAKELNEELSKEKVDVWPNAMTQLAKMLQFGTKEVKADPLRARKLHVGIKKSTGAKATRGRKRTRDDFEMI